MFLAFKKRGSHTYFAAKQKVLQLHLTAGKV
jgi:hypothetical protein